MSFASLLNQDITVYSKTARDRYGKETFGSGTSVKARFQHVRKSKVLATNEVLTIDAIVFLEGDVSIEMNDKISYGGINYKVVGRNSSVDGQGNVHHYELELQKWSN